MRPLIKTNWTSLPLSIPVEWKEYFEDTEAVRNLAPFRFIARNNQGGEVRG
jgi:hypothetical protein